MSCLRKTAFIIVAQTALLMTISARAEDGIAPPTETTFQPDGVNHGPRATLGTSTPVASPTTVAAGPGRPASAYTWPDRSWRTPDEGQTLRPIRSQSPPRLPLHALRLELGPLWFHGTLAIEYEAVLFWKMTWYASAYIPLDPDHHLSEDFDIDLRGVGTGFRLHFSRHHLEGVFLGLGLAAGSVIIEEFDGSRERGWFLEVGGGYGGTFYDLISVSVGLTVLISFEEPNRAVPWMRTAIGAAF